MIDFILGNFFTINKKSKLTIMRNRKTCFDNGNIDRKIEIRDSEETCLSSYFVNIKGLNVKERKSQIN